ncbi:hypothetical protein V9K67_16890 [Paraflavisolibacter sp. H34]|uniref:hypothetical protein n=1 Tax=Huijunlia imazamoxiresistens TaxID=3127457 RepID=UPI0030180EE7
MQQPLSPRKYIETKARSLPLYHCYVNRDWKEAMFADVIVMRRHTNGHVTVGLYQVELLCQGITETAFIFNEDEAEVQERIPALKSEAFTEIDYNLAHNIIFAGHDFALDFEIQPEKDFALTRFILEEDTDAIPLIDIPVGDGEGRPVLMATANNLRLDILAKLKKFAGEGNYVYLQEDEEEEEEALRLDALAPGEVNLSTVQRLHLDDMNDEEKVSKRLLEEQILIETESLYMELPPELTNLSEEEDAFLERTWEELLASSEHHTGVTEEQVNEYREVLDQIISFTSGQQDEVVEAQYDDMISGLLESHGANPIVVSSIYETSIVLAKKNSVALAGEKARLLADQYPIVALSLALGALVLGEADSRFDRLYQAQSLEEAFPGTGKFSGTEVIEFLLIRLMVTLKAGRLKEAVVYFMALRAAEADPWLLVPVFAELNIVLEEYMEAQGDGKDNGKEQEEE